MNYLVLFAVHRILETEIVPWRDSDGVLRVFSTKEQAEESAYRNSAVRLNGFQVVPFSAYPVGWVVTA